MSKAAEKAKKADERRRLFAKHYVIHMNAKAAAEAAGSEAKDLAQAGYELLCHADTQRYIEEERDKRAKRTDITADKVLKELACIAFSDIRDFVEWKGHQIELKDSTRLKKWQARGIAEVSYTDSGIKFKLYRKERALELLGRHLKMFTETIEVPGLHTLADLIAASMTKDSE